jgi:SWIM/SEC-C metal-binding protein
MARIGTEKRPAILRVQTEKRFAEIADSCRREGIHFIIDLEPDEPEDISDLDRALNPPAPILAAPKICRNEPCPCGSGAKFKKCCG